MKKMMRMKAGTFFESSLFFARRRVFELRW